MEIISNTREFYIEKATAVAIGKFDGVHIGHRRLLREILKQKQNGLLACVFTFDPAPAALFGRSDGKELTTREEKRILFERMGVDILIEFPLTKESAAMEPEVFVRQVLKSQMNTKFIAAGTDLSFGAGGRGNALLLNDLSKELDFTVKTIDKVCINGKEVSSTYIRSLLEQGDMKMVEECLGMPYMIIGEVKHGNRIGRTIGFPTVNQLPETSKLLPPFGVYTSTMKWSNEEFHAISNIGCKPTVTEEKICGVETYVYDFEQDIYDNSIEIYLHDFKRPEQKFQSLEALKAQLMEDIRSNRDQG